MYTKEAAAYIRKRLREKTGKPWSVRMGRGTAGSWITVESPKARHVGADPNPAYISQWETPDEPARFERPLKPGEDFGRMSEEDAVELAAAFNMSDSISMFRQHLSIPPDERDFHIQMLNDELHKCPGIPEVSGCRTWIPHAESTCKECAESISRLHAIDTTPITHEPTDPERDISNLIWGLTDEGKVPAIRFEFDSEYPAPDFPWIYHSWAAADRMIAIIRRYITATDSYCFKTWITVLYADGQTYEARMDLLDRDSHGLADHIRQYLTFNEGKLTDAELPSHLTREDYNRLMTLTHKTTPSSHYTDFISTYEIGTED